MDAQPVDILLIEDNQNDIELTLRALKKNGIANHIYVVNDGEEALDFLYCRNKYAKRNPNNTPKIILLDLKLPKVDGLEVLKALKSDPDKKIIPVIVMTSSDQEKDMIESYKLGVNSYIKKPVDFEQFVESVRQVGMYWLLLNRLPSD
ncbi:response regulator receiver protein [Melioribacter roseus P3M-2]|uniref:Response regulator receiver protein n=1 Tax=Melioribacter roseus (strain DSM 23840 / JCM 17771 / VKM B-2668 / P3M-2) TaxID=1191523 RepID=I6ZNC1_MELRP|nr:response regulator [Melioribacter roseus]AFN73489.1 response regulator receiver protein [Melioribacter roseus P3M-2]